MTNDGNNTLVYDAENRVLSATNGGASGTYSYDGNSLRVKKVSGSTTTIYIFSGTKVIAEYSGTSSPYPLAREYIYSGGALLAKIESGATKYYHQDHLSNRVVTDSSGNKVAEMGHYPFGESWYDATNDKLLFTSYERDSESGNDYAMARSYVNRLARFSSPDPLSGSIGNPQSLNRYAYAFSDPINLADPTGLTGVKSNQDAAPGSIAAWMALASSITTWNWVSTGTQTVEIPYEYPITVETGFWDSVTVPGWGSLGLNFGPGDPAGGGPSVDQKILSDCIQKLFGFSLYAYTQSTPGGNGYFIGSGPDAVKHNGQNSLTIVTNDATTYSAAQLNQMSPPPPGQITTGLTTPINNPLYPFNNFTANDVTPLGALVTQVHELGHSLYRISTGLSPLVAEPSEQGHALEDCVKSKGGFRKGQ